MAYRKHLSAQNFRTVGAILLMLSHFIGPGSTFVVTVDDQTPPGSIIFHAGIGHQNVGKHQWEYHLDLKKSPAASRHLLHVDRLDGKVRLRHFLPCGAWPVYLHAWKRQEQRRSDEAIYLSIPIFIISRTSQCSPKTIRQEEMPMEMIVALASNYSRPQSSEICFSRSQLVLSGLTHYLPESVRNNCRTQKWTTNRLAIESFAVDLVSPSEICLQDPQLRIRIDYRLYCTFDTKARTEAIDLVFQRPELNIVSAKGADHGGLVFHRRRRALSASAAPFYFDQPIYIASVAEESDNDSPVITLTVKDTNTSIPVLYSMVAILDARSQKLFQIDPHTGSVSTTTKLDREIMDVHYLRITAEDSSHPPMSATTTLQINVDDINDFSPTFEQALYETSIKESASIGSAILTVRATDQDTGANAEIHYSIVNPFGANEAFRVDSKSGVISTRLALDREIVDTYNLTIQAVDQGAVADRKSATTVVLIRVADENDNYPQFSEKTYTVDVPENISWTDNLIIAKIRATDADSGTNAVLRYSLIGGNNQGHFVIDSLTGDVSVVQQLDYESVRNYRLVIRAQDGGNPTRSNTTQVLVNVKDINDNSPRFYTSVFQETVIENVPVGHSIVRVQAYDADDGVNAAITYTINPELSENLPFGVDPDTGWIVTVRELDREENHHYEFEVSAVDGGEPRKSATAKVILQIQDQNDNDPVFDQKIYEVIIGEDALPGTPVLTVTAADRDENPRLQYQIINGNVRGRFSITSQNGQGLLSVAQPLDYKQEKRFVLTVSASDSGGRSDIATVYINVSDANTHAPAFETTPYSTSVFEDAPVGTTVLVVAASDGDVGENARITYSMSGELVPEFTIHPNSGAIVTTKPLDREKTSGYLLTITARDNGHPPLSDTTDVEIIVVDVNDNAPIFNQPTYHANVPEDALIGTSLLQVLAVDADQGLNSRVRYLLQSSSADQFTLDATSGILRTNKLIDRESVAKYDIIIYAVDRGSPELSTSVPVTIIVEDINDSPPSFDSDRLYLTVNENSPIGSKVGDIQAHDPDEGQNAIIHYSIIGGNDADSFTLISRPELGSAELLTRVDLDYESSRKRYELIVRAASPPLRTDIVVQIDVVDVNDNVPVLKDFRIVFNNFKNYFPSGPVTRVPVFDADVNDKLLYRVLSGNNANLLYINETSGEIRLSPNLNTNVPISANMEVSVSDGLNEVKAELQLMVLLVTDAMLFNSVTLRLNEMDQESFLSPLYNYFVEGLAAIIPCPKENIFIFNIQDDFEAEGRILNVSFSAKRPDVSGEVFYTQQFLRERVYLRRHILTKLTTLQVLPFDDTLCVREPCLNFEECLSVLKFGKASSFINSETILFRPIYPVSTFACRCPSGFTGMREHYVCDTEVNLCYSNPCEHGGKCVRKEGGYACICKQGFTGSNCEIDLKFDKCKTSTDPNAVCQSNCINRMPGIQCRNCTGHNNFYTPLCQLRSRSFYRGSFLTFPALRQRYRLHLKLSFATRENNGLLLYNGRYNERNDFLALEIIEGRIRFSYSLGANISRVYLTYPSTVSDGQWHTIAVDYVNRTVVLSLDECNTLLSVKYGHLFDGRWNCATQVTHYLEPRCAQFTETCHRFLDLTAPLQIGGLPSASDEFQVANRDYSGCIRDLYIDHTFVDLNSFVAENGTIAGCQEKNDYCMSAPCRNGGKCVEGFGTFICDCLDGFAGKDCSESIDSPKQFKGDGYLIITPNLRPIVLPWVISFYFRTRQPDTFLMKGDIGSSHYIELELVNGRIRLNWESSGFLLDSDTLNNGKWHYLEVKWMQGELWLSVDFGLYEKTVLSELKLQGLYLSKVSVGSLEGPTSVIPFIGCIKDLRLGNQRNLWQRPAIEHKVSDGCIATDTCAKSDVCPLHGICTDTWNDHTCTCEPGFAGFDCTNICDYNPCENNASCVIDKSNNKGYKCVCNNENISGEHCEITHDQPCPAAWWGYPVCGPCQCNTDKGYDSNCNKKTGECVCQENHYQPLNGEECFECNCYLTGSFGPKCDTLTGQCTCRPGVIGRRCDSCSNRFAEVTLNGCTVLYDACPRSFEKGVWFDRTPYGSSTIQECPTGSHGKAYKICDKEMGWLPADFFNCTSTFFLELKEVLAHLENGALEHPFQSVRLAEQLYEATNHSTKLYGNDINIAQLLLRRILQHETNREGFNMTHRHDKYFIRNIVSTASSLFHLHYIDDWRVIEKVHGYGAEMLLKAFQEYAVNLGRQQSDTYTIPFEIVTPNMVLGMDVLTSSQIFGAEVKSTTNGLIQEKLIIPDTTQYIEESTNFGKEKRLLNAIFPKYNNYIRNPLLFDKTSKMMLPLSLLGFHIPSSNEVSTPAKPQRSVVTYALYRTAGEILPQSFESNLKHRYGVELTIPSTVLSATIYTADDHISLSDLTVPLKYRIRVEHVNQRANPQCVSWKIESGKGVWSRDGCRTEFSDPWFYNQEDYYVNCTCSSFGPVAVAMNKEEFTVIREPTVVEDVITYVGLVASVIFLSTAYTCLTIIRGLQTNSNSIHRNFIICLLLAQLIFLLALKLQPVIHHQEFSCKLMAMGLHYIWLCVFSWLMIESIHLYRMLSELRDVNHGQMRFYYSLGYGLPAVILGLSIGVRADQYGNYYFCWLSLYESVIWSLVGPCCVMIFCTLIVFGMGMRAAFTLKDHIEGYGNLRTLIWLGLALLPLTTTVWVLAVLSASDSSELLFYAFSLCSLLESIYIMLGYCLLNQRVRTGLLRLAGQKVAEEEIMSPSSDTRGPLTSRSSLAYQNSYHSREVSLQRHVGISTSSTTSRSTCKTSSSNYRSDLRDLSTSTASRSSYDSRQVQGLKSPYAYDPHMESVRHTNEKQRVSETGDSDEQPSMDLASSHSSDEEETTTNRSLSLNRNLKEHRKPELPSKPSFMPNISEAGELPIPPPTPPNMMSMSTNIRPLYSPAWSSQLPPAYPLSMSCATPGRWISERLSNPTSDEPNKQSDMEYMQSCNPLGASNNFESLDCYYVRDTQSDLPNSACKRTDHLDGVNQKLGEAIGERKTVNNLSLSNADMSKGTTDKKNTTIGCLEMTDSEYV